MRPSKCYASSSGVLKYHYTLEQRIRRYVKNGTIKSCSLVFYRDAAMQKHSENLQKNNHEEVLF